MKFSLILGFLESGTQFQMTSEHEVYWLKEYQGVGENHQLTRQQVNQQVEELVLLTFTEFRSNYKEQYGIQKQLYAQCKIEDLSKTSFFWEASEVVKSVGDLNK